jgi:integrase
MSRLRSTGVKPVLKKLADGVLVLKKLADGSTRIYYYDRETGRSLGTDRDAAMARAVRAPGRNALSAGTIAAVIVDYKRSAAWSKLAPRTRDLYTAYLDIIHAEWGDLPVRGFHYRYIGKIQDDHRAHPRKANQIVALLRVLMGIAVKQELILANPIIRPEMLPMQPRTQLWSREEQAAFLAAAPPRLHLPFILLLYTTQRLSDVLAMTKGQIYEHDGRLMIELRQQKTGTLIAIPAHRDLVALLRARLADPTGGLLLVPSPRGLPWTRRNFSRAWDQTMRRMALRRARELFRLGWAKDRVRAALGEQHRQRRDLRRTGIVRMAEAGVTMPQIASISGHKIDHCQEIIDTYLPRRTEVAIAAMAAWEAGEGAGMPAQRVVRLADRAARGTRSNKRAD